MLVIPAVALAAVLAYAVLANTGMQQQISANAAMIAQADCVAESGINYALYNLQNPDNAPQPLGSGGFWTGGTFDIANAGAANISVSAGSIANTYVVTSVATITGSSISRTLSATVQAIPTFGTPNQAVGINGSLTPASGATVTVTGDLRTTGAVTLGSGSSVSGNVYATSLTLSGGTGSSFVQTTQTGTLAAPTSVTDFRSYTLNGVNYTAILLTTDPTAGKVLGPTITNPAGVYYTQNRTATLNGVTINGTLIVKSGNVNISGSTANTITPMANFPGLVVDKQIVVVGASRQLTVNGLTWAGTGLNGSGSNTGSTVTVNGSLLIPSTSGINNFSGALNLNYTAANVNVPNFSTQLQQPKNVTVLSWSQ